MHLFRKNVMGTDEGKNDRLEYSHARRKLAVALELLNREAPRSNYLDNSIVTGRDARIYRDLLLRHGEQVFGPKLLDIACSALGSQRKLSFLQVGANDGITNDPIHQLVRVFGETVVLIEPISDIIPELKKELPRFFRKSDC